MAKIVATFDTNTKKFEVSKDGEPMDNIERCSFGKSYDGEYMCVIDMMARDKENSMMETKTLYASKNAQTDKLQADIVKYLSNRNA